MSLHTVLLPPTIHEGDPAACSSMYGSKMQLEVQSRSSAWWIEHSTAPSSEDRQGQHTNMTDDPNSCLQGLTTYIQNSTCVCSSFQRACIRCSFDQTLQMRLWVSTLHYTWLCRCFLSPTEQCLWWWPRQLTYSNPWSHIWTWTTRCELGAIAVIVVVHGSLPHCAPGSERLHWSEVVPWPTHTWICLCW